MEPVTMGILAALPGLIQAGSGIAQFAKGNRIERNNERPEYEIPQEILDLVEISRRKASDRQLPGEGFMRDNNMENMSSVLDAITRVSGSGADAMSAITNVAASGNRQERDLAVTRAGRVDQNQELYKDALKVLADFRDKKFDFNEFQPYMQRAQAGSALQGAGMQNMFSGASNMATAALLAGDMKKDIDIDTKGAVPPNVQAVLDEVNAAKSTIPGSVPVPPVSTPSIPSYSGNPLGLNTQQAGVMQGLGNAANSFTPPAPSYWDGGITLPNMQAIQAIYQMLQTQPQMTF